MWTCKKCGNTEIVKKEITIKEKVGKINPDGDFQSFINNEKVISIKSTFHCSICGNSSEELEDICSRTDDMYISYWVEQLEQLHKNYYFNLCKCLSNKERWQLYCDKENSLHSLLWQSSKSLEDYMFIEYNKIIDRAIKNCQYRLNKYSISYFGNRVWYITNKLKIDRCYQNEEPIDKYEFGQYKFYSKKSCEEWVDELKKYK